MGFTAILIFILVATLQYCSGNLNHLHLRQNNARFSSNYSYETKYFEQQVSLSKTVYEDSKTFLCKKTAFNSSHAG